MRVKLGKFVLIPVAESDRFDMVEPVVRMNKKTKKNYDSDKVIGYSMTLEYCCKIAVSDAVSRLSDDELLSLEQYVKMYRDECSKLKHDIERALRVV